MDKKLEAGKIVNTHGVNGDLKVEVWLDSPLMLKKIKRLYISEKEYYSVHSSIFKDYLIVHLDSVNSIDDASLLKGKILFVNREDIKLQKGRFFISDIIGFECFDTDGNSIGVLTDIIDNPAQMIYVVKGNCEHLIPAVKEFTSSVDIENKKIIFKLIEGL